MRTSTTIQAQVFVPHLSAITINGHQLQDALGLIAPQRTPDQLAHTLCMQSGPARQTRHGVEPAGLFCWLADYPDEGSVRLDEQPRSPVGLSTAPDFRAYDILVKVVEAARWIAAHSDINRQPDAYRLVRAVLDLSSPLINSHVDALCSHEVSTAIEGISP